MGIGERISFLHSVSEGVQRTSENHGNPALLPRCIHEQRELNAHWFFHDEVLGWVCREQ